MRKLILMALLVPTAALAQEVQVLSIMPRMAVVQQQRCEQVAVQQQDNSGVGTIIGGVAGGIIGNQVGGGSGKTAATAIGAVVGAMAGNSVGGQGTGSVQNRAICSYVPVQTQIGKTLVILFEGRQYHIQTP